MFKSFRELPLWRQWLWVSAIGATTAECLLRLLGMVPGDAETIVPFAVFIAQWILLRGRARGAGGWFWASAVSWAIGLAVGGVCAGLLQDTIDGIPSSPAGIADVGPGRTPLGYYAALVVAGLFIGIILGFGQWLVLRRTLRRAGWWIPAMVAACVCGSLLELVVPAVGLASTLALTWLWESWPPVTPEIARIEPPAPTGWRFLLQWIWLTCLGFVVGQTLNNNIVGFSVPSYPEHVRNVLAWLGGGACVGTAQLYLLRDRLTSPWRWIPVTAGGWALSILLFRHGAAVLQGLLAGVLTLLGLAEGFPFELLDYPLGGLIAGTVIGVLQWILMRRDLRGGIWWPLANAVGWALTYFATNGTGPVRFEPAIAFGAATGSLTGLVLTKVVRRRVRTTPDQAGEIQTS